MVIKTTERKPDWLKIRLTRGEQFKELKQLMRAKALHTVCEEAKCPNIHECWANRTATFMILGNICTRACRFCAVTTGKPTELDLQEPDRVADAVIRMELKHVVITSVARDDLSDGGAAVFAETIRRVKQTSPLCSVEVLIPDFNGEEKPLAVVLEAGPHVLNHNLETVERLSDRVRARAKYRRSLELLRRSKRLAPSIPTKSGLMVGLGESAEEVLQAMDDLRAAGVDILTIGQYLQPTRHHLRVEKYYTPEEFERFREEGLRKGFRHVESGPLVRSSYHAKEQLEATGAGREPSGGEPLPAGHEVPI
jgi:lipoic acid synthetase